MTRAAHAPAGGRHDTAGRIPHRAGSAPSGAVAAAAAAYKAGFRGWPLVIMTAIAGRESGWDPKAGLGKLDTNGYPSTGLWQINAPSAGGLSPSQLTNPVTNAKAAFRLAGGNKLTGLSNWALANSPSNGSVPQPIYGGYYQGASFHPLDYSIARWIPQSVAAADKVETASPNQRQGWLGSVESIANGLVNPFLSGSRVGGSLSLPGAVGSIAGGLNNIASPTGPFADLFHLLAWITQPKSWLRIFCGIAGVILAAGGVYALAGMGR